MYLVLEKGAPKINVWRPRLPVVLLSPYCKDNILTTNKLCSPKFLMTEKLGYNAKDGLEWVNSVNIIEDFVSSHSYFPSFPRQLILAHYGSLIGSGMNLILLGEQR